MLTNLASKPDKSFEYRTKVREDGTFTQIRVYHMQGRGVYVSAIPYQEKNGYESFILTSMVQVHILDAPRRKQHLVDYIATLVDPICAELATALETQGRDGFKAMVQARLGKEK